MATAHQRSMDLVLHDYWRSSASYRVRIALTLKGLDVGRATHDLRAGEQDYPAYVARNPQGLVPALEVDGTMLTQSPAIIEWLDETYPDPPLLPRDPIARATVRAMAATIACDIHPLNNLRVLTHLREGLGLDGDGVKAWAARWIGPGFAALEAMVARHGAGLAYGATPTMADCFLVPQIYSAERFGVDLAPYPRLAAAAEAARALPAFRAAHPDRQPDAD